MRRAVGQSPEEFLDMLFRMEAKRRERQRQLQAHRELKRDAKHAAYARNGLNGPRAMARRWRQAQRIAQAAT